MDLELGIQRPNHLVIASIAACNLVQPILLIPEKPHWPLTYRNSKMFNFITELRLFYLKHRIWGFKSFETTQYSQNVLFVSCYIFFSSYDYLFEMILHDKDVSWGFDIYHLTFGDKNLRVLCLHIWNQVLKTITAKLTFQVFKRSLSDWFGPKCKCKISRYLNNSDNCSYNTTTM